MQREIKKIVIKLTDRCNLNCVMCGQRVRNEGAAGGIYIKTELLKKFFQNIPENMQVYLWGGEPLLHPDFEEIVKFFISKKGKVSINTNAFLLDKYLDFLIEAPIESMIVSIDGLGDVHDSIRRTGGLFKKVKESLFKYIEGTRKYQRKNVVINFTILKDNYLDIEEFCDEIKSWDVHSITMNFLILVDKKKGNEFAMEVFEKCGKKLESWKGYSGDYKNIFDYDKLGQICESIVNKHGFFVRWSNENFIPDSKNLEIYYEKPDTLLESLIPLTCEAINKPCSEIEESLAIDSNGNIVICPDFPDTVIGSIETSKYENFYNREIYSLYGLDKEYKATCYRCAHRSKY
ncbi:MAG: radical SAM protein [Endomicrobia bacterium]|nr:radical SAM protein [Endomicrobiia bacterium]